MNINFFKKIPLVAIALVVASTAFAGMDMDSRVSRLEKQMSQAGTENSMDTFGVNTASARPEVNGKGWYLTADVLYWRATVNGTAYAYSDLNTSVDVQIKGREKSIDFDWDYALRFGIGYNFDHDGWDTHLNYTWFDTNGSDSSRAGLNSIMVQMKAWQQIQGGPAVAGANPNTTAVTNAGSAKSMYDFDYQSLDLELGRNYFISSCLSFRPHFGLKSAWIDQSQITRYTDGDLATNTVHVKDDCDFWGLGPRTGVDSKWHLGHGFSLFNNIAVAVLYGHFDVDHKERSSDNTDTHRIRLHANLHAFSSTLQNTLGLAYDTYIHDNQQHFGISLGYESEYWWRQNQMLNIDQTPDFFQFDHMSEDVSMHGITLNLKWDF